MKIRKTLLVLIFAVLLLIFSLSFLAYKYISYSEVLSYWGNNSYSKVLWQHPMNMNLAGVYKVEKIGGLLNNLGIKNGEYNFKIVQESGEMLEFTLNNQNYIKGLSRIYVYEGTTLKSENLDLDGLTEYLSVLKVNAEINTPTVDITISENVVTAEKNIDYIFLSL